MRAGLVCLEKRVVGLKRDLIFHVVQPPHTADILFRSFHWMAVLE
jgi:hypothetical protein